MICRLQGRLLVSNITLQSYLTTPTCLTEDYEVYVYYYYEAVGCNHHLVVGNVYEMFLEPHQALISKLNFPLKLVHLFTDIFYIYVGCWLSFKLTNT